jgi:hypothetical protein
MLQQALGDVSVDGGPEILAHDRDGMQRELPLVQFLAVEALAGAEAIDLLLNTSLLSLKPQELDLV